LFENLVKDNIKPKNSAKWIVNMLLRYLNDNQISLSNSNLNYDWFKLIIEKEQNGDIL
jgi:Asp-tRNA(Asn)/Glu-tRNA(Gln) amidotransferase B subunit